MERGGWMVDIPSVARNPPVVCTAVDATAPMVCMYTSKDCESRL